LYSSVSYSEADMNVIESELVSRIERNGFDDGYVVRPSEVAEAINQLKLNKRDGSSDLFTNHLKFACSEFFVLI
jgi:hypothetical protein